METETETEGNTEIEREGESEFVLRWKKDDAWEKSDFSRIAIGIERKKSAKNKKEEGERTMSKTKRVWSKEVFYVLLNDRIESSARGMICFKMFHATKETTFRQNGMTGNPSLSANERREKKPSSHLHKKSNIGGKCVSCAMKKDEVKRASRMCESEWVMCVVLILINM